MNSFEAVPPDLADLCTEIAERVCDAIEHRKAIGHDFMRATGHTASRSDFLHERIRKLRGRIHRGEEFAPDLTEPSHCTEMARLTAIVANRIEIALTRRQVA